MRFAKAFILTAHLLFILILLVAPTFSKTSKPKKIQVHTIRQSPAPTKIAAHKPKPPASKVPVAKLPAEKNPESVKKATPSQVTPPQAAPPQAAPPPVARPQAARPQSTKPQATKPTKKPAENPKQIASKQALAKKTSPENKKTPEPKTPERRHLEAVLAELEESIAKIEENKDKLGVSRPVEKGVLTKETPLEIFSEESSLASDSYNDLIGFLHDALQLPDYGKVKLQMQISRLGVVSNVIVLESESAANSEYLKTHLPGLILPMKGESGKEKSFVINFCNEM